jgi:hypothetical protein
MYWLPVRDFFRYLGGRRGDLGLLDADDGPDGASGDG